MLLEFSDTISDIASGWKWQTFNQTFNFSSPALPNCNHTSCCSSQVYAPNFEIIDSNQVGELSTTFLRWVIHKNHREVTKTPVSFQKAMPWQLWTFQLWARLTCRWQKTRQPSPLWVSILQNSVTYFAVDRQECDTNRLWNFRSLHWLSLLWLLQLPPQGRLRWVCGVVLCWVELSRRIEPVSEWEWVRTVLGKYSHFIFQITIPAQDNTASWWTGFDYQNPNVLRFIVTQNAISMSSVTLHLLALDSMSRVQDLEYTNVVVQPHIEGFSPPSLPLHTNRAGITVHGGNFLYSLRYLCMTHSIVSERSNSLPSSQVNGKTRKLESTKR